MAGRIIIRYLDFIEARYSAIIASSGFVGMNWAVYQWKSENAIDNIIPVVMGTAVGAFVGCVGPIMAPFVVLSTPAFIMRNIIPKKETIEK